MSELILPPGITIPKYIIPRPPTPQDTTSAPMDDDAKASTLPVPAGWKLLCVVPDVSEKFDNSDIVKADSYMRGEEHGTTVLFVLRVGPDAYTDKAKFPTGAWCKAGDFVLVRTYSGTRVKIFGKEFRLINDDQVDAVVADPRGISRAAV
jgi:co-chaperonin GroES (HSP10)